MEIQWRRFKIGDPWVCGGIGLAGALVVLALRYGGILQASELYAYDVFLRLRAARTQVANDQIALVEISEDDVAKLDYPLPDAVLAEVLRKIEAQRPAVIGMDIFRDLKEPRSGSGKAALDQTLLEYPNIISIFLYGSYNNPYAVAPPDFLKDQILNRVGINNFPRDNETVRRAFIDVGGLENKTRHIYLSFSTLIALRMGVRMTNVANGVICVGGRPVPRFSGNTGGYLHQPAAGYQESSNHISIRLSVLRPAYQQGL